MTTRDDAIQGGRVMIWTTIKSIAEGAVEVGAATPVVAPLCIALLKVKEVVDGASRNGEVLNDLFQTCALITVQVINKARNTPEINVAPLQECFDKLAKVAKRYHDRGFLARLTQSRRDGDDIQKLSDRIHTVVGVMGLAVGITIVNRLEEVLQNSACQRPKPKLATVPREAPVFKSLPVVRGGKVDRVCKILAGGEGPSTAALTGGSGAGKTTSAASMVGERGDRLRALFPDGVVWLDVGKGEGKPVRLRFLMLRLAGKLHKDVMKEGVDALEVGEDGESYVKKIVSQEKLKCLVVADDVWEKEVVEKLRGTGMWVLLTTRECEIVEPQERVFMGTLTEAEARDVLRGAAELQPSERLCNAAMEVLKICGDVAMDTAFVASWIRQGEPKRKDEEWARAVERIKAQGGGAGVERNNNRHAILRAGFEYLGEESVLAQYLYMMLTVLPDGHAFGESDAVVLLGDGEVATKPMSVLERWGVLKADASDITAYRMHDAHVTFAREKFKRREDVRGPAVERWTGHISRLDFAGLDVYALLRMWRALEEVDGSGWWITRPYDHKLIDISASNSSNNHDLNVVAELYEQDQKFAEMETLMRGVLEGVENDGGDDFTVPMTALWYLLRSIAIQGRFTEDGVVTDRLGKLYEAATRRLGNLHESILEPPMPDGGAGHAHWSTTLNAYGVGAAAAGRHNDGVQWFRKALEAQEKVGLSASLQAVSTLLELGRCLRKSRRSEEAEKTLQRALQIKAKLGPDDLQVAWVLQELGLSVQEMGRRREAVASFERMRNIVEARKAFAWVPVAQAHLDRCLTGEWRPGEAEAKRALDTEAKPQFFTTN